MNISTTSRMETYREYEIGLHEENGVSSIAYQQNLLEAATHFVDDLAHVRHEDDNAQRPRGSQEHQKLSDAVRGHLSRQPAEEEQTDEKDHHFDVAASVTTQRIRGEEEPVCEDLQR